MLKGVDLAVGRGEVVAILGPSGSGKSTLLHLLAGLDKPTQGEVWWDEVPVHRTDNHVLARLRRARVGLVFQNHYLLQDLSVLENVTLSGRLSGHIDTSRGETLLRAVGLAARRDFLPNKLSGGERQRVAVARALYAKPAIVLADEPTGSLDRHSAGDVFELLVALARDEGGAVVMVTHDEGLVRDVDRRYYLNEGRLNEGRLDIGERPAENL
ncbi:ABC transporter ATP-binding protein [soil metagenome]